VVLCQSGSWQKATRGASAWVNFNGTSCPSGWCAIRSSYNVSSIWRSSAGVYTVYFQNPLPDSNYVTNYSYTNGTSNGYGYIGNIYAESATGLNVSVYNANIGGFADRAGISLIVYR